MPTPIRPRRVNSRLYPRIEDRLKQMPKPIFPSWYYPSGHAFYDAQSVNRNQGIQGGQAINNSGQVYFPQGVYGQLPLMQKTNTAWLRLNFRLGNFSSWTPIILGLYDIIVSQAIQDGFSIVGLLSPESWPGTQTDWTANNNENTGLSGDNTYIQNFASNAASILAGYFYRRINYWEIWNEPDAWTSNPSAGVYTGGTFIYPSNFAWLLKHCHDSIASVIPQGNVIYLVSGGLFVNDLGPSIGNFDTTYYIPNFINYGQQHIPNWGTPFDFVGEHIYIDQGGNTSSAHMQTACDVIHNTYTPLIGSQYRTIITEYGWTTVSVSQAIQASNLQIALQVFQKNNYIARSFQFAVQDTPGGSYGLFDTNGNPKLSLFSFLSAVTF